MIFFSRLGLVFNFSKKNGSQNFSNFHICYREFSALQNGVGFISGKMLKIGQKNYFIILFPFFCRLCLVFNFSKKNFSWNVSNFYICHREFSALQNGVGFVSGKMLEIGQKNYYMQGSR